MGEDHQRGEAAGREENGAEDDGKPGKKAWFGVKRVGFGLRPQTWQGWALVVLIVVVVVGVRLLMGGHPPR